MDYLLELLQQILNIINEMSPYLLLGFLLAGMMHAFVPGTLYSRYMSGGNFRSVLYAALFGIPLPLCSCGVIPTAMSLRREGASRGAAVSFLIATPQTGVDSIIATYSLMGLPYAIVRPIAALVTAIFGGQLVNATDKTADTTTASTPHSSANKACTCSCECDNHCDNDDCDDECGCDDHCSCGCGCGCGCESATTPQGFVARLLSALRYGFVEMMGDIGKWLVVGLVVAGLITVLVPDSWFALFEGNTLLSMLLVLCIAIPMYICATGSIPIAVALIAKGLTPGAALVLLMAGPACNVASMLVVGRVLGRRTLITYLVSIIIGSVLFGIGIDHLLPAEWFTPTSIAHACCEHDEASWWSIASTITLGLLLVNALVLNRHHHGHDHDHNHNSDESVAEPHDTAQPSLSFIITGMNCSHCRANAIKVIKSLPQVTDVDVDLASGKATVHGNTDMDSIRTALASIGFAVKE